MRQGTGSCKATHGTGVGHGWHHSIRLLLNLLLMPRLFVQMGTRKQIVEFISHACLRL